MTTAIYVGNYVDHWYMYTEGQSHARVELFSLEWQNWNLIDTHTIKHLFIDMIIYIHVYILS